MTTRHRFDPLQHHLMAGTIFGEVELLDITGRVSNIEVNRLLYRQLLNVTADRKARHW